MAPERFVLDGLWLGSVVGPVVVSVVDGRIRPVTGSPEGFPRLHVTLMPGVVDHHVHLGLVQRELLADGPLVEVHDLGWVLEEALGWRENPPAGVTVRVAGPFHTAPGGYPSGRAWAPELAVRAVVDVEDARRAG